MGLEKSSNSKGYIDIAMLLYDMRPDMDVSVLNESPFINACINGHLDIVKWLLKIKYNIDITARNDYAFITVCEEGRTDIATFLQSLMPHKYIINISDNSIEWRVIRKLPITGLATNIVKESTCPICYDCVPNIITTCEHQFCKTCIEKIYNENTDIICPICRDYNIDFYLISICL